MILNRYVPETEIKTFGTVEDRQEMLSTGWIGKAWRANYTVTSRLPIHPSMGGPNTDYEPSNSPLSHAAYSFVHGGISPTYLQATPYPSSINTLGSSLLRKLQRRKQPPPHPPNPYPGLPDDATKLEHDLYGTDGPLWYRGWALNDDAVVCKEIDAVLEKTGTRRLIMGHTPTFDQQVSRCGGKIIIIDTYAAFCSHYYRASLTPSFECSGISHAYGGVLSALDIQYSLTPINDYASMSSVTGTKRAAAMNPSKNRFLEREVIHAIYPSRRVLFVSEEREVVGDYW